MSSLIIISKTSHALKLSSYLSALLNHSQNEVVQTNVFSALKYKSKDMAITMWLTLMKKSTPRSVNYKSTINSPSWGFRIAIACSIDGIFKAECI